MNENLSDSKLSADELTRYSRHLMLPGVGVEGQEKLKSSSVLIIGMGGLGSPAALYLAAAGVGVMGLMDFDKVEIHNLQRQIIHSMADLERNKVSSATESITRLNPECEIIQYQERLSMENIAVIFQNYDIILDGSDNFPTRYLVNDAAYFMKKPLVYGSIFQFEGQASIFAPHLGSPCYRCIYPTMPEPGTVPSCAEAGVFGAMCGMVGSIQAMEAIKLITGVGNSLAGQLLTLRTEDMNFRKILIKRDPDCPLCGNSPTITKLDETNYSFHCGDELTAQTGTKNQPDESQDPGCCANETLQKTERSIPLPIEVSVHQVQAFIEGGDPVTLIDVREPWEYNICKLPNSENIPMGKIPAATVSLSRNHSIIVYCHHGMRSLHIAQYLRSHGFRNVSSMKSGINAWSHEIDANVKTY